MTHAARPRSCAIGCGDRGPADSPELPGGSALRWLVVAVALAVLALVFADAGRALPPILDSVGEQGGFATARWTLPDGVEATFVEVANAPTVEADGSFPCCAFPPYFENAVLEASQTQWTGKRKLPQGTYYVHVQGFHRDCYFGGSCPVREWSGIKRFTVGGSGSGSAPSRAEATQTVLAALKSEQRRGAVVVFATPQPVAASARVTEGVSGRALGPGKQGRVGRRAWLFWQDEAPHARFQHPSRLVLVDAGTGKVLVQKHRRHGGVREEGRHAGLPARPPALLPPVQTGDQPGEVQGSPLLHERSRLQQRGRARPRRHADADERPFTVKVAGEITGGQDTQGFRQLDMILLVNDRWDGRTAVGVGQNCADPIGAEPISCTPPATNTGTFTVSVPTPRQRGDTFSFGVGALNCSACYVRYEYTAR